MTLAHVSDLHLGQDRRDDGARAMRRAERVVAYFDAIPGEVDAILVTGDIADHGAPGVVSTGVLPFEAGTPLDYQLPPAVAFHVLDGGRLTTHFRIV